MAEKGVAVEVSRRAANAAETTQANRRWWDAAADDYQSEHGEFLGGGSAPRFIWGPEGLDEADAQLLGVPAELAGRRVLEIGCGAAQCGRWLRRQGADVVALDLSAGQLAHARRAGEADQAGGPGRLTLLHADVGRLPLADRSIDIVCSAYGALPFVADASAVLVEIARALRPAGRLVFSVTHPIRWALPDDPGPAGLTVRSSYFDRTPYVEADADGLATYVEHHRTIGDWVRAIASAGLIVTDLIEPEWPDHLTHAWGGWSPLRGRLVPGTAVFVCEQPGG